MAILTVSRQIGSWGEEIARRAAQELGYACIDKGEIETVLAGKGVPTIEIEKYHEKKPSLWELLALQRSKFLRQVGAAIYGFASQNDTIILGRGGQVLLKEVPGTLHLRITAPAAVRLQRIMDEQGCGRRDGERLLRRSDRESSGYIRAAFGVEWDDETLYDLVISTRQVSEQTAVGMIRQAVEALAPQENWAAVRERLNDLALQQQAEAILLDLRQVERPISVRVEKGVALLTGSVPLATIREDCARQIAKVQGVVGVTNEIVVLKSVMY